MTTSARTDAADGQFALRIDATSLKDSFFRILGVTPEIVSTGAVQTLRFSPGFYAFQVVGKQFPGFVFRVKPDGTLDYDANCDGFLNGRDRRTLTTLGANVSAEKSRQTANATSLKPDLIDLPSLVIDGPQRGLDVTALRYNDAVRVLYVGRGSQDLLRQNLYAFKVGADGTTLSTPNIFTDHPVPLVASTHGQVSWVRCMASDPRWSGKLYLGLEAYQPAINAPNFTTPLVVYDLDTDGMPVDGTARAFSLGGALVDCLSIAFHPSKPWLYAVGRSFAAVAAWALDESSGLPIGEPMVRTVGGQLFAAVGKVSIGVTLDEALLCLGTYPSLLELLPLNPDGSPGPELLPIGRGSHFLPALPSGPAAGANYVPLTVGNREVYYISENGLLANFGFDADGNSTGGGETAFNWSSTPQKRKWL